MLRSRGPVRILTERDLDLALEICAEDPVTNVFAAARIQESGLIGTRGPLLGYEADGERALCWCSANVVPVGARSRPALDALAARVAPRRATTSSVFGDAAQARGLWARLEHAWGVPREIRQEQLVMTARTPAPIVTDPQVRPAAPDELDLVVPAAYAMFTEEIGYPPYQGSGAAYRRGVSELIRQGRTLVRIEDGRVVFKADLGSVALGVAQIQGVWVHPDLRGRGLAAPAMASVLEYTLAQVAPVATLYVNDFNERAVAAYRRAGFERTGTFTTILL